MDARELSASFTDANLHAWRDVLDEFLSRATIRDVDRTERPAGVSSSPRHSIATR